MNSKINHIKPAFAPETEFLVETLTLLTLSGYQPLEDSVCSENLDLSAESDFVSCPRRPFSALND